MRHLSDPGAYSPQRDHLAMGASLYRQVTHWYRIKWLVRHGILWEKRQLFWFALAYGLWHIHLLAILLVVFIWVAAHVATYSNFLHDYDMMEVHMKIQDEFYLDSMKPGVPYDVETGLPATLNATNERN